MGGRFWFKGMVGKEIPKNTLWDKKGDLKKRNGLNSCVA